LLLGSRSGEALPHRLGNDHLSTPGIFEPSKEHHLTPGRTGFVKGDPHAVRMSQLGSAVIPGKVLRQKHIFASRFRVKISSFVLLKHIDGQGPIDHDGFIVGILVKEDPSPKTADSRLTRLAEDGIGPNIHHVVRGFGLGRLKLRQLLPIPMDFINRQWSTRSPGEG
jgi:hypothetical protein